MDGAGDAHMYPRVPQTHPVNQFIRTVGRDTKPIFLSEYGIGSLLNAIGETRHYEQVGADPNLEDFAFVRSMAERFQADWNRFKMEDTYPFAEDMLRDSQRLMARQRLLCFDVVRSNPKICGYNLTGMLDHAMTGEGLWTFWREWKPESMEALQDGWAPLRWCLFAEPMHAYAGRPIRLEAVLANEDVLRPGEYPVHFRVFGSGSGVWERKENLRIPQVKQGEWGPLAVPGLNEEVNLNAPPGTYRFTANMERGGAPLNRSLKFYVSDASLLPQTKVAAKLWGVDKDAENWLKTNGVLPDRFDHSSEGKRQIVVVGNPPTGGEAADQWKGLARQIAEGSVVVFLSPLAFQRDKDPVAWLPLEKKGRCYKFNDWLYHKECVAKPHPIFKGLQPQGIMDWDYYGQVVPEYLFDGQDTPDDVAASAFAVGYSVTGGYASGLLIASFPLGKGRFVLNTCKILENLNIHPAADRLLLNMIKYAAILRDKPSSTESPANPDELLRKIGYLP